MGGGLILSGQTRSRKENGRDTAARETIQIGIIGKEIRETVAVGYNYLGNRITSKHGFSYCGFQGMGTAIM